VKIYRPVANVTVKKAATGLCWSLSRERAVAEAVRADGANPRILQASVELADIIYWGNSRGENEVVPRHAVEDFQMEAVSPKRPPAEVTSSLVETHRGRSAAARVRARRRA
jgi:hypothetical protein